MTKQAHDGRVRPTTFSFKPGEGIALGMAVLEDALQAYRNFEQQHPHMERTVPMPFNARQLEWMHASLESLSHYLGERKG
ncbi:hypothetical protein [Dyella acidiphila]|uniref:Uncharacterized protein n=1 Tax=Dyella acidiphila TaxID=2775866 RepID=A0ABR9GER8_9GAMM|nr:hypothetical protein [Dyella acidiphila]MBE1162551.1 hypothetical protein [Dyella acidiphila]